MNGQSHKSGIAHSFSAETLAGKSEQRDEKMKPWFTIENLDDCTHIISEYRHWEETHCYLIEGDERTLLIDTGLGICDISSEVKKLTNKPVTAVATHIHRCDMPENYDVGTYELFQGTPSRVLYGGERIELGGRSITVLHTPGHSPGHMCFFENCTGYLFTGDLVYKDTLLADFPSTDPRAYRKSLERIAALPVKRVFPAHHTLDIQPKLLVRMRDAFRRLDAEGKLHHGSGTWDYGDWAVRL